MIFVTKMQRTNVIVSALLALYNRLMRKLWSCTQVDRNCFDISVNAKRNSKFELWTLCAADHHFDSLKCDRELIKKHMNEAKERNAVVCFFGDLFDAMQGRDDHRGSKASLRTQHARDDYFDAITQEAAEFFGPYAKNIAVVGEGNHESKVRKVNEICLNNRFIALLNQGGQGSAKFGSYSGTIRYRLRDGSKHTTLSLAYHHGSGYKSARKKEAFAYEHPDSNICVFGHNHDFEKILLGRQRVSQYGKTYRDHQTILGVPPYKDDYGAGDGGFAVQGGHRIKILGAWWIRMFYNRAIECFDYECLEAR